MSDAASDPANPAEDGKKGGGAKSLVVGLVLGLAGAAGGYFAATSGLLPGGAADEAPAPKAPADTAYVDIDPMIVSIARPGGIAQLRLNLSLEVDKAKAAEVAEMMPRLLDVLNSYLRALDTVDIGDASTLVRLRSQMLRRVQIVVGGDTVKDILIQEFVVN
ncbi:MAG: flagellar basal body-associated FliL family protein [Paracoccaceae bacterium]|nr:flagellar basal body-associated FliL family protein [Paracoccaceae bacterium]